MNFPSPRACAKTGFAAAAVAGMVAATAPIISHADTVSLSASVTVSSSVSTLRYVGVAVLGKQIVSVDKVSDPYVQVTATGTVGAPTITQVINAPGGSCAAVDDPDNATFNRSIMLDTSTSGAATMSATVAYTETAPDGSSERDWMQTPNAPVAKSLPGYPVDVLDLCVGG